MGKRPSVIPRNVREEALITYHITTMPTPSYKPMCPNHDVALEGCGFPLPKKGMGRCPISGAGFDFEAEVDESKMVKGKDGTLTKATGFKVTGDEE